MQLLSRLSSGLFRNGKDPSGTGEDGAQTLEEDKMGSPAASGACSGRISSSENEATVSICRSLGVSRYPMNRDNLI